MAGVEWLVVALLVVLLSSSWVGGAASAPTHSCPEHFFMAPPRSVGATPRCYKRVNYQLDWAAYNDAACAVEDPAAALAAIQSPEEMDLALVLCPHTAPECWTGLNSQEPGGTTNRTCCWQFASGDDPAWVLANAGAVWAAGHPNNGWPTAARHCVALGGAASLLHEMDCRDPNTALCSVDASPLPPSHTPSPSPTASSSPSPSSTASSSPSASPTASSTPSPSSTSSPSPSTSSSSSPSPTVSSSPSTTATSSPSPSGTSSPSPTASSSPSPKPSGSSSPSPTATSSPSPSSTPSPTPSTSTSPSPSPTASLSPTVWPTLSLLVENVEAAISADLPSVDLSTPDSNGPTVGVTSAFQDFQLGADPPATIAASEVAVRVEDRQVTLSEGGPTTTVATHIYSTVLPESTTTFDQAFAFHGQPALGQFGQANFAIGASTLKWSLNFTGGQSAAVVVRYRLSALGAAAPAAGHTSTTRPTINRRPATPGANMTTYSIPLGQQVTASSRTSRHELGAQLVVFDVAMVDDQLVPLLSHNVVLVVTSSSSSSSTSSSSPPTAEYVLELTFPAFRNSLYYDPSLSLGVLLEAGRDDPQSSSLGDSVMVIGLATALPIALIVVVAAGIVLVVVKRKRNVRLARRLHRDLVPPHWFNLPDNEHNVLGGMQTNELFQMSQ